MPAAVRNVVRLVDFLPSLYSVGVVAVLATRHHQRLGDLAAGTLVVRTGAVGRRAPVVVPGAARPVPAPDPGGAAPVGGWDLTGVSSDDEAVVRAFLARRDGLDPAARARVASQLAGRLAPLVRGPDRTAGDEAFLEQVLAAREARAR